MKWFTLCLSVVLCILRAQAAPERTSRIINGQYANHHPYNAYIVYKRADQYGYFGGGTIISDRHILTAAMNIYGFVQWDVGVGSNILTQLGTVVSYSAIAHPSFNSANRANDIGVITLPVSLVISSTVSPIALPPLYTSSGFPFENEQGTVVGFGFTDVAATIRPSNLMISYQRVISNIRCQQHYQVAIPNHFCSEDTAQYSNVCNGDLGAGFISYVNGVQSVTGVASMISQACGYIYPAAYTRVEPYRAWINSVTGI
ncbi:chymotrypsin-like [Aedes albopictus]|uniref:Peptidase S1 domain-containing protein n=1 Tax=Aedes albopictus TaxID=7160 RepID=A0ABM1YJL6_AEDAL